MRNQQEGQTPRMHLEYLDGVRALAALYVVGYHSLFNIIWTPEAGLNSNLGGLPPHLYGALLWLHYGGLAVSVFIVLSGYCLMIPVARTPGLLIPGGVLAYLGRRARRILPPYYAAMMLSLLLIVGIHGLHKIQGVRWDASLPVTRGVLISHLFLLHDLRQSWYQKLNGPAWSVAVEWQIYFLLPVLVLLWRRFGLAGLLLSSLVMGIGLSHILRHAYDYTAPWYIALFGMGAAAAAVNFSSRSTENSVRADVPWGWASIVFGLLAFTYAQNVNRIPLPIRLAHPYILDLCVGATVACLLVFCTKYAGTGEGKPPIPLRVFRSPALVFIGTYSYSIYLIHDQILGPLTSQHAIFI